jgi:hypothetical protein
MQVPIETSSRKEAVTTQNAPLSTLSCGDTQNQVLKQTIIAKKFSKKLLSIDLKRFSLLNLRLLVY